MAARGRVPQRNHPYPDRRSRPYPPPDLLDGPPFPRGPRPPHPEVYEEELELRMVEIRRLASENRRLHDDRIGLQRDLGIAREEIHRLGVAIGELQAERDVHVRELVDKGLKMEADLRAAEPLRNEVVQLRSEVQKLEALRHEQVQGLTKELDRAESDVKQVAALKSEVDGLRQELVRTRSAFEYEKKGNVELVEQRQVMEKNLVSMAREVERLRAELAAGDGRSNWGPAYDSRSYGMKMGSPDGGFPSTYGDGYGLHLGSGEKTPLYGVGSGSWNSYDKSRTARR